LNENIEQRTWQCCNFPFVSL